MEFIDLYPEEKLEFAYSNPFQEELGRLSDYQGTVLIPKQYYVVGPKSHLVASNYHVGISQFKRVILESLPRADSIGFVAEAKLAIRTLAPHSHTIKHPVVSLVHRQASNYGHWLMDYLPRAFAALHFTQETGATVKVIVPDSLASWQRRSLELIGIDEDDLISVSLATKKPLNMKLDLGLFMRSHSYFSDSRYGCRDALSPLVFTSLKAIIMRGLNFNGVDGGKKRVFVLRKSSGSPDRRFIINEAELRGLLMGHHFQFVYLEDLSLDEQVSLFVDASHIIAVHGSGLSNLIFSEACNVLELFSSGHGIRPEYWQLSAMTHGQYAHIVVDTKPPFHDICVPLDKIQGFLDLTL